MLRTLAILSGAGSEWTVSPFRSQCAGSYSNLHALPLVGRALSAGGNGAMELRRSRERCVRTSCTWWRPVRSVARCRREVRPVRRQQVEADDFVILPADLLKTRHEKLALFLDGQSTEPREGCERRFHPEPVGIHVSTTSSRGWRFALASSPTIFSLRSRSTFEMIPSCSFAMMRPRLALRISCLVFSLSGRPRHVLRAFAAF
jgi:hypothetical protein